MSNDRSYIVQKDTELKEKLAKSAAGNAMVPDLTTVDRYRRELRELNKKIAAQSAKVSGDGKHRGWQAIVFL